jgi:predicted membrane metal-binding protein
MRELITLFLPIGAVLFLLAYVFLIDPHLLYEFGYWLQKFL